MRSAFDTAPTISTALTTATTTATATSEATATAAATQLPLLERLPLRLPSPTFHCYCQTPEPVCLQIRKQGRGQLQESLWDRCRGRLRVRAESNGTVGFYTCVMADLEYMHGRRSSAISPGGTCFTCNLCIELATYSPAAPVDARSSRGI